MFFSGLFCQLFPIKFLVTTHFSFSGRTGKWIRRHQSRYYLIICKPGRRTSVAIKGSWENKLGRMENPRSKLTFRLLHLSTQFHYQKPDFFSYSCGGIRGLSSAIKPTALFTSGSLLNLTDIYVLEIVYLMLRWVCMYESYLGTISHGILRQLLHYSNLSYL